MKEDSTQANQKNSPEEYPLNQLYLYLTEGCNLACRHCWLAPKFDPDGSKYAILPFELFQKAVMEAVPLGLSHVKLTGGEPLLHPDFLPMLKFLKKNNIGLTLETNGMLLTREIAREIAGHDNPFVSVSLDGADAETHERIRGVEGSFNKAIQAIRNLADNGIHPQVIMSVMQVNAEQVEPVIELAETLGADSVKFNIIQPTGRGEAMQDKNGGLAIKKLVLLGRRVESQLAPESKIRLYFDYPAAFRSLGSFASGDGCGVCGIFSILGVLPTGEYALCGIGSHVKELVFGRIGKNALAEIWENNIILKAIRSGLPDNLTGICSNCLMKHQCLGSCIAQNYYRSGSLWGSYWFCEQALSAGQFPGSRLVLPLKNQTEMI